MWQGKLGNLLTDKEETWATLDVLLHQEPENTMDSACAQGKRGRKVDMGLQPEIGC